MELSLNLVTAGRDPEDVAVQVEPDHEVGELAAALSRHLGRRRNDRFAVLRTTGWETIAFEARVGDIALVTGDQVAVGTPPALTEAAASAATDALVRLAVTSGPDAGRSFELGVGAHSVGRSTKAMITLSDPLVSRQHFVLDVGDDGTVELFPNSDASNPPRLQGEPVDEPVVLARGEVVQVGATRLRVRDPLPIEGRAKGVFGRLPFHRTPYFRTPIPEQVIAALGDLPVKPKPRRFQFIAAISPMIMGVGMALLLGSMRYLLFALFSPVMAGGTWWDQRRSGGREYDDKVAAFDDRLDARRGEITRALATERACRLENNPDIELLARRVDSRHNELWQRDRHAEDFLSLRIGVGTGASKVKVEADRSGDDEFREQLARVNARADKLIDVPIAVGLAELGTVGLIGAPAEIDGLAAALIVQACCLHSPEDVVVMAAVSEPRDLVDWMKWLPHCDASSSPLAGPQLVTDRDQTDRLLKDLVKVAEQRAETQDRELDRRWPWLVVAIDRDLEPDAATVSRLLDLGAGVGISVLWLTDSPSRVPRQASAQVVCAPLQSAELSELRFTDPNRPPVQLDPERVRADVATEIARALAPMRDATAANAVTSIPRTVPLFAALGTDTATAEWVGEQWLTDRGYSLQAPIGLTDTGPLVLDLVEHGPHGLIGGTSGAGKSELVQSLVASLAAHNSPERINFLFVDYKGGALSELFRDIPHTVGAVTNLDALLALRALTSLTAELDRRMELFKGRATDIKEMLAKHPDEAPPSLVIVVDEFAALVRELPEFVDGIVSIAERGRSLGIHLLMSTQRPSGAINDNIQQNTNLRIALRMLDAGESNNVIGAPDAAMIPTPLKGRGLARLGPGELLPFQSAWSGAPVLAASGPPPVMVRSFGRRRGPVAAGTPAVVVAEATPAAPGGGAGATTQLQVLLGAIRDAADRLGFERGRAPWKPVLPSTIPLAGVLADPRSIAADDRSSRITIGMVDDPAAQDQFPAHLDFAESGAAAIFGNSGSGKSNALLTIASAAAWRDHEAGGGGLTIFALDFASRRLGLLARFPQTSAVATGDDLEAVTRIVTILSDQLERRRAAVAEATSRGEAAPSFSRALLLLDGYENFVQQFESGAGRNLHLWIDVVNGLIAEGRQYGIDVAFTAARRGAVRSSVMSSITNRFVLRQSDDSGYIELGVPAKIAKNLELAPGQGFDQHGRSVQLAVVTGAPGEDRGASGKRPLDEQAALAEFARSLTGRVAPEFITQPLPAAVPVPRGFAPGAERIRVGVADRTLAPVDVDLRFDDLVVVGPPRSGKSTALSVIAGQAAVAGAEVWVVGPAGSPLADLAGVERGGFGRLGDIVPVLEELATAVESFPGVTRLLVFDDADQYDDRSLSGPVETIVGGGVRVIGSVSGLRGYGSNPAYASLKAARTQIVLCPEGPREVQELVGVLPDLRPGTPMPPGRGVLVANRIPTVVQCVNPDVTDERRLATPTTEPTLLPPCRSFPSPAVPGPSVVFASGEMVALERPVILGRRPSPQTGCEVLRVNDRYLSARHLTLEVRSGRVVVTDCGSRNGTFVCRPGVEPVRLDPGVAVELDADCELLAGHQRIAVA